MWLNEHLSIGASQGIVGLAQHDKLQYIVFLISLVSRNPSYLPSLTVHLAHFFHLASIIVHSLACGYWYYHRSFYQQLYVAGATCGCKGTQHGLYSHGHGFRSYKLLCYF